MYKGKLGIGLISFDRCHYFKQEVESILKNTHLEDIDFHLFQDGSVNRFNGRAAADEHKVQECIEYFNSSLLPNKYAHIRKQNAGVAINEFEAYETLTPHYEWVMLMEDDIILSPHYLRLLRVMIDQFGNEDNIFSMNLNFRRSCHPQNIKRHLYDVIYTREMWWAECINSKKWPLVKKHYMRYHNLIKDVDWKLRPHDKIAALFAEMGYPTVCNAADTAFDISINNCCNMKRICTIVNRGIGIGEIGDSSVPSTFVKHGFSNQEPYIFPEDENITKLHLDSNYDERPYCGGFANHNYFNLIKA